MKAIHKKRLLNVARALRESPNPDGFCMGGYATCGSPMCALGHYASRGDLQRAFVISDDWLRPRIGKYFLGYTAPDVHDHFGITPDESDELFSGYGCGGASTTEEAAKYHRALRGAPLMTKLERLLYRLAILNALAAVAAYVWMVVFGVPGI